MSSYIEDEIQGETVKIYCEAKPEYYLTAKEYDDVVLALGDESDPHQQWIMDASWGIRVRDRAGFPSFALINKATRQALRHGTEESEKVNVCPYSKKLDEATLWTQSDEVGNGYKCIRPVDNPDLNLDANNGEVEDGTDLIIFKWKKQESQKWKIYPISNTTSFKVPQSNEEKTYYGSGKTFGEGSYEKGQRCESEPQSFGATPYEPYCPSYSGPPAEYGSGYEEAAVVYPVNEPPQHFPERMPEGKTVKIYCEQSPDFFVSVRDGEVLLTPGDEDDVTQHWIKVDKWGNRMRDEADFPAFALVNKATLKALKHGSEEWDKVDLCLYNDSELDESILWTQSADVGHGFQCIRPVQNIRLNLDAKLADGKYGDVKDGNELILFKWKKQKNQKWKMQTVY